MNIFTFEYELFKMACEEISRDMEDRFIHIFNHLRTLGKSFQNKDLIY